MKRWVPSREELRQMRWLHPIAHHFDNEHLWRLERGSVARAVAIGLFFGLLIPVAQFLFAIATAIALRAHIAIAAASTLITNPFTFPPIYWAAFEFGRLILGRPVDEASAAQVQSGTAAALASGADAGMFERMVSVVLGAGAPLVVGLASFAVIGATTGFVLVWVLWRPRSPDRSEPPPPT